MRQPIGVIRGTTHNILVSLYDDNNRPYELQSGEILRFGVKSSLNDESYEILKEITSSSFSDDGKYVFGLMPSDTINLKYGIHYYDVGLQTGNSYYNIIECSAFEILHNVTEAGANV